MGYLKLVYCDKFQSHIWKKNLHVTTDNELIYKESDGWQTTFYSNCLIQFYCGINNFEIRLNLHAIIRIVSFHLNSLQTIGNNCHGLIILCILYKN